VTSGLIILIGFVVSTIFVLIVWFLSKNTQKKSLIGAEIQRQKTEIIDIIERAVGEGKKGAKPQQQTSGNGGMPVWRKWGMALSVVPLVGSFVLAGMQGREGGFVGTAFAAGKDPFGICFDGNNIWVTNHESNDVIKLRASDGAILGQYVVGQYPSGICFDGTNIWVASPFSSNVTKLKASDGTILGTYTLDSPPGPICSDGNNIWVTNPESNDVIKLRASDGAILGRYSVSKYPGDICFDGNNIWVTEMANNDVIKLRASDGVNLGTFAAGSSPSSICFDGNTIWVTNPYNNDITKLRATDGVNLGTFAAGKFPFYICSDGTNIWVSNTNSNVTKLRANDGAILGTYKIGKDLNSMCFDGSNMWFSTLNNLIKLPVTTLIASATISSGTNSTQSLIPTTTKAPVSNIVTTNFNANILTVTYGNVTKTLAMPDVQTLLANFGYGGPRTQSGTVNNPPDYLYTAVALTDVIKGTAASPGVEPGGLTAGQSVQITGTGGYSVTFTYAQIMNGNFPTYNISGSPTTPATTSAAVPVIAIVYWANGNGLDSATGPFELGIIYGQPLLTDASNWVKMVTTISVISTSVTTTPSATYPANGATGVSVSGITFTWPLTAAPAGNTITYQFALAQASANTSANEFAILDYSDNISTNAEPCQETLQYGTVYWWEVRAVTMSSTGAVIATGSWTIQMFTTATK
jgi:outer membrane lipoprotein-sorting protein